jgi:hypothetical protein
MLLWNSVEGDGVILLGNRAWPWANAEEDRKNLALEIECTGRGSSEEEMMECNIYKAI